MITRIHPTLTGKNGAVFSDCERYRYRLWREWDKSLPRAVFVLMNPSTADEIDNDPTIERCCRRVMAWQKQGMPIGRVDVVNVFAWRETDSTKLAKRLREGIDLVGPDNDRTIFKTATGAGIVVCAWGKPGELGGRGRDVLRLLRETGQKLHCLRVNGDGSPEHPLYIGCDVQPVEF